MAFQGKNWRKTPYMGALGTLLGVCRMSLIPETQRTLQVSNVDDYLLNWLEAFLIDRKAAGVATGTLRFYRQKIKLFADYCDAQAIKQIRQVNSTFLRQYLLYLEESGHNAGGRHAATAAGILPMV
jgi:hypothetical protein